MYFLKRESPCRSSLLSVHQKRGNQVRSGGENTSSQERRGSIVAQIAHGGGEVSVYTVDKKRLVVRRGRDNKRGEKKEVPERGEHAVAIHTWIEAGKHTAEKDLA